MYNPGNQIVGVSSFYTLSFVLQEVSSLQFNLYLLLCLLKNVKKTICCNIPFQPAS